MNQLIDASRSRQQQQQQQQYAAEQQRRDAAYRVLCKALAVVILMIPLANKSSCREARPGKMRQQRIH
jgi:hypothetical protein